MSSVPKLLKYISRNNKIICFNKCLKENFLLCCAQGGGRSLKKTRYPRENVCWWQSEVTYALTGAQFSNCFAFSDLPFRHLAAYV